MSDLSLYRVFVVEYPDRKFLVLRHRDPFSGKTITRSARTTNRREAERRAAAWEGELLQGKTNLSTSISWAAFRERYETEVVASLAEKTGRKIDTVFDAVERILQPRKLADLDESRLSYFQAQLRDGSRAETTIKGYLSHLRSALRWAHSMRLLATLPRIEMPKRAKSSKVMKGRPITPDELQRMLDQLEPLVGHEAAPSWRHYLCGLWWSGLRLTESLELYWDDPAKLCIWLGDGYPMLRIPAELEKGYEDRVLPLAPEFAEMLLQTPDELRTGPVFSPQPGRFHRERVAADWAMHVVARLGKAANIVVHVDPRTQKKKYASAHDLRRSFGQRWGLARHAAGADGAHATCVD